MKPVIVVDLDGTLCDSEHREEFALNKDWDAFHEMSRVDEPRHAVLDLLKTLSPVAEIVGCTGRPEKYRGTTEKWLMENDVPMDDLLMRPDHEFGSDTTVKPDLLMDWLEESRKGSGVTPVETVWFILEDRDKMVERWRDLGFDCWQVKHGGY